MSGCLLDELSAHDVDLGSGISLGGCRRCAHELVTVTIGCGQLGRQLAQVRLERCDLSIGFLLIHLGL
ncbi:hypothetical protein [Nocardia sp. alder85J]|uniref:hypothetical protein n=1 Tax=Nocardia sp. alder85J TaxID=2862949 RepID=UPI001CD3BB80|nr:hypothetical protein [Nocardia sp. alder85J]MCX4093194.1 hypothetical protein [Nocardia sp. alder85J]